MPLILFLNKTRQCIDSIQKANHWHSNSLEMCISFWRAQCWFSLLEYILFLTLYWDN